MKTRSTEGPELVFLLAASALFHSFVFPFDRPMPGCSAQEWLLASIVATPLLCLLLVLYQRKTVERVRPRWFQGLMMGVLLLSLAMGLQEGQRFYSYALGSHLPLVWFLALVLGVAAYGQSMSEGALGRAAQAVLALLAVSTVLLFVSVAGEMRSGPLLCCPLDQLDWIKALQSRLLLRPEYLLLPLLSGTAQQQTQTRAEKQVILLPVLLLCVEGILALTLELVLGPSWRSQLQPVYLMARLGRLSVFRRMDAWHLSVWIMLLFLRIALYVWAIARMARDASHRRSRTRTFCLAALGALLLFGWVRQRSAERVMMLQQGLLWVLLLAPLAWRKKE